MSWLGGYTDGSSRRRGQLQEPKDRWDRKLRHFGGKVVESTLFCSTVLLLRDVKHQLGRIV